MITTRNLTNGGADGSKDYRLDPMLADQLETTLNGVYAFNADTAKYGLIWVWIPRLAMIAAGIAALVFLMVGLVLIVSGQDIEFGTNAIDSIGYIDWPLWLAGAAGFAVIAIFMAFITKAVSRSHRISIELASRYRAARS